MKNITIVIFALIMTIGQNVNAQQTGTMKDTRDGKVYKTVKIGEQWWFAENLDYDAGSYSIHKDKYGGYYSARYKNKKYCPSGWRVPSKYDFEKLLKEQGGLPNFHQPNYSKIEEKNYTELRFNGEFNAKLGGYHGFSFFEENKTGCFLTTSTDENNYVAIFRLYAYDNTANFYYPSTGVSDYNIRCVCEDPDYDGYTYSNIKETYGTFKDSRDGKTYKTIKIGNQVWMAENLAYKPSSGNYWAYDDDQSNVAKYGYLYDWETAKKIVPKGWHLPTRQEFKTLLNNNGGEGEQAYKALVSGGNSYLNVLLGGWRMSRGFDDEGDYTCFWAATEYSEAGAWRCCLSSNYEDASMSTHDKSVGFSVRLIKDR